MLFIFWFYCTRSNAIPRTSFLIRGIIQTKHWSCNKFTERERDNLNPPSERCGRLSQIGYGWSKDLSMGCMLVDTFILMCSPTFFRSDERIRSINKLFANLLWLLWETIALFDFLSLSTHFLRRFNDAFLFFIRIFGLWKQKKILWINLIYI